MAYQQKDNSGSLFKNDKRENDGDPQATGQALIDGVEYWVKAWTNEGKKGKWQKLSFQRKQPKQQPRQRTSYEEELDDEVPF